MTDFRKDCYGNPYTTADGKSAPTAGGTIYVPDSNGSLVQSTWMGYATKP